MPKTLFLYTFAPHLLSPFTAKPKKNMGLRGRSCEKYTDAYQPQPQPQPQPQKELNSKINAKRRTPNADQQMTEFV